MYFEQYSMLMQATEFASVVTQLSKSNQTLKVQPEVRDQRMK
jgi:hypothetical protein